MTEAKGKNDPFEGRRGPSITEQAKSRYVRQFPGITDKKAGKALEYEIDRKIALYILDGKNKAERLDQSSREHPFVSYTGQSRVWKEARTVACIAEAVANCH